MKTGIELIEKLSMCFGPTSCEGEVEAAIREELEGYKAELFTDRMGNLTAHLAGPEGAPRIMLSAHMDEVGFMVTEIEDDGCLRVGNLGGFDHAVLTGRGLWLGDEHKRIPGVIAAKGIHQMDAKERKKLPDMDDLYVDIGTSSREESEKLIQRGDFATFDTVFSRFGKDGAYVKGKALDDRAGCAVLIEVMRDLYRNPCDMPFDVYFAFTTCEEVGVTGAGVAAFGIKPDTAIILEATGVNDLPGVGRFSVSKQGDGGTITMVDLTSIYDMGFVNYAMQTAEEKGLKCQIKRTITGSTDAGPIQRSLTGVRVMGLSIPTRYIHSASCVALYSDYEETRDLVSAMLRDWKLD